VAARLVDGGRLRDWVAFTLLIPLGFFAIPIMLYPAGGVVLWMLLAAAGRRLRGRASLRVDRLALALMLAGALTVALYIPVMARNGLAAVIANRFVAPRPYEAVVRELPGTLARTWHQWNLDLPPALAVALAAAAGLATVLAIRGRGRCGAMCGLTAAVFAWTLAIALIQRVVPFDRVWLFLLPLYAGCVACGLDAVAGRAFGLDDRVRLAVGSTLAVVAGLGLVACVVVGGSIPRETEKLTMNDGEAIARDLKPILRPRDGVLVVLPADAPLKYYFLAAGIPVEHLYDYRVAAARRLYIAVNRPNGQTPESVLRDARIAVPPTAAPRLVRDYGRSALYVLDR
jgi:hypothetical protein